MNYDGISRETLFLLADNRFRNSKEFYDEHKEELKSGITVPMRQIAGIISSEFAKLDPLMVTNPVKMVSRIRRDTRYTKDQSLYRENMWICLCAISMPGTVIPPSGLRLAPHGILWG